MSFFSFDKGDNFKLKNESNKNEIKKINPEEEVDQSLFDENVYELDLDTQHKEATKIILKQRYSPRERETESALSDKKPEIKKNPDVDLACKEEDNDELKKMYKPVL